MLYHEKKIKSGKMLEIDFYPVHKNGGKIGSGRTKAQKKAQDDYNLKKSERELIRRVNCNFDTGDLFVHLTYGPKNAPQSYEEAKRDINNYLRRINNWRKNNGLDKAKYIIIIEEQVYKTGERAGQSNWHFHVFLSKMPRDVVEQIWNKGRVNADRYQPDTFGQTAAAQYCAKDPRGKKRFICSRNCVKPKESEPKQRELSHRKIQNMCEVYAHDSAYWQRRYPGYSFKEAFPVLNPYNGKWYLRVEMRKISTREKSEKSRVKRKGGFPPKGQKS